MRPRFNTTLLFLAACLAVAGVATGITGHWALGALCWTLVAGANGMRANRLEGDTW